MREEHPSLRLVRKAKMGALTSRPPIVLVHGVDGRIDAFGFYQTQCHDHDILALGPPNPDAMTDPLQMVDEYTEACVSHFGTTTAFHMIAYSFGTMLARYVAGRVVEAGGCPLGLVLLDPLPFALPRPLSERPHDAGKRLSVEMVLQMAMQHVVHGPEIQDIIDEEFPDLHQVHDNEVVTYVIGEACATRTLSTALAELNALNQAVDAMQFCGNVVLPHIAACDLRQAIPVKVMVALASPEARNSIFISQGWRAEDVSMSEESYYYHATMKLRVPGDHFEMIGTCASGRHDEFNESLRDFFSTIETIPKEED